MLETSPGSVARNETMGGKARSMRITITGEKAIIVKLRLFPDFCYPYLFNYELTNKTLYVSSYADGYTTKANAKRAAVHMAEKLGLEIKD